MLWIAGELVVEAEPQVFFGGEANYEIHKCFVVGGGTNLRGQGLGLVKVSVM